MSKTYLSSLFVVRWRSSKQDKEVLEFAMAYEAVTDYLDRRPEMVAATV